MVQARLGSSEEEKKGSKTYERVRESNSCLQVSFLNFFFPRGDLSFVFFHTFLIAGEMNFTVLVRSLQTLGLSHSLRCVPTHFRANEKRLPQRVIYRGITSRKEVQQTPEEHSKGNQITSADTRRKLISPGEDDHDARNPRSHFLYGPKIQETSGGARNDSTYISFRSFEPSWFDLKRRLGMSSYNNIMTTPLIELFILFVTCISVSIILWHFWVKRHYEIVYMHKKKIKQRKPSSFD